MILQRIEAEANALRRVTPASSKEFGKLAQLSAKKRYLDQLDGFSPEGDLSNLPHEQIERSSVGLAADGINLGA